MLLSPPLLLAAPAAATVVFLPLRISGVPDLDVAPSRLSPPASRAKMVVGAVGAVGGRRSTAICCGERQFHSLVSRRGRDVHCIVGVLGKSSHTL